MKAIVDQDIITKISETHGTTEIGNIPFDKKGRVGFDRLRFDGDKIVDLMDLEHIWVEHLGNNFFALHAVEVPGSQKKKMSYSDRARLVFENGAVKVRTPEEIGQAKKQREKQLIRNRLRSSFNNQVGDPSDQTTLITKLVYLLILSFIGMRDEASDLLRQLLVDIEHTYPMDKLQSELPELVKEIRSLMTDYRAEIGGLK